MRRSFYIERVRRWLGTLSTDRSRAVRLGDRSGEVAYGYEFGLDVAVKAGSLYPILMRLRDRGLLDSS